MTKRPLPYFDRNAVVRSLADCRHAMIALRMGSPTRSLGRAAADQMISNIDELAWILTGERDLLKTQGHAGLAGSGPRQASADE